MTILLAFKRPTFVVLAIDRQVSEANSEGVISVLGWREKFLLLPDHRLAIANAGAATVAGQWIIDAIRDEISIHNPSAYRRGSESTWTSQLRASLETRLVAERDRRLSEGQQRGLTTTIALAMATDAGTRLEAIELRTNIHGGLPLADTDSVVRTSAHEEGLIAPSPASFPYFVPALIDLSEFYGPMHEGLSATVRRALRILWQAIQFELQAAVDQATSGVGGGDIVVVDQAGARRVDGFD